MTDHRTETPRVEPKVPGRFECGVCGKRIWRGWFAPGVAGGPPSPVKCGACSNPPRAEEIPAEWLAAAREVDEIRELVGGMFEERTNNATSHTALIEDIVDYVFQERQRGESPSVDDENKAFQAGWDDAIGTVLRVLGERFTLPKKP